MSHHRPSPIEDHDYDHLFSDEDVTFYKEFDDIDSRISSPTNPPRNRPIPTQTHSEPLLWTKPEETPLSSPAFPVTPSSSRRHRTVSTSALSAMKKAFSDLELQSPPPRLTPGPASSFSTVGGPRRLVIIDDDESDEEGEVSRILTGTEEPLFGPLSPATSSISLGSTISEWSILSASSPSKYRKVGTNEYDSSYRSQAAAYSSPSQSQAVVPDVFSASYQSSAAPKQEDMLHAQGLSVQSSGTAPEQFLSSVNLDISIIAHDTRIQDLLDGNQISWGVQFELARGVTTGQWTWDAVESKVGELRGPSAKAAQRVRSVMLDLPQKAPDLTIWEELDREQMAIIEHCERGLGLMGEWQGDQDWHGGQIQQLARLVKSDRSYMIHLEPMEKRRSHRFARYLGSRRMIQLRIPDELVMKELPGVRAYLSQKFVLCGRVFVSLHAKDNSVYMIETNEDYERQPGSWCGDEYRQTFADVINWHNPLELNKNQPISKWSTRFTLGLSNSIPVLIFDEENIHDIDDIYASDVEKGSKAPAEKIMTDGCGFINRAAGIMIRRKLHLTCRPTAVQARIKGAKGLFIIHPTDTDPEPKIWIRKSQDKIKYLKPLDRAHRVLDLVTVSTHSASITLSRQSIINLSHNGISEDILIDLLIKGLTDEVKPLMDWNTPQAMIALWHAISRMGGVTGSRTQRQVAGRSRAIGLQRREWGHVDVGMEDDPSSPNPADDLATQAFSGRNEDSGSPLALHECAVELVQSGFHPSELKYLRDKIRYIVNQAITTTLEKYQIPLPLSTKAFIVPDPLGVLKEGEIFYRSSQEILHPETQTFFNVMTGDVLLGRYPLRLPSDIQKVQAVDIPALYDWPDVVITSTKGSCSLASLLAGGDHDGDEVFLILLPLIVQFFESKPLTEMPKALLKDYFEGQVESVTAFSERVSMVSTSAAQKAFQEICLLSLNDSKVGLYSGYHDYAVWRHGLEDPKSVRMAYMFNTLLDSSKTGLRLKPGVFEKDRAQFGSQVPDSTNTSKPYILHALYRAGAFEGEKLLQEYDEMGQDADRPDKDLKAPYSRFVEFALNAHSEWKYPAFWEQLNLVKAHVSGVRQDFNNACKRSKEASPGKKKRWTGQKDPMLAVCHKYAEAVEGVSLIQNIDEVKASYAYHESPVFAFAVAFRDLCLIKARVRGIAPSTRAFDEAKSISTTYLRAVARIDTD